MSFRRSPGSQPSPSRQVPDRLQLEQMRSPCQVLINNLQHMRQIRRFCVELRSALGLLEYGKWVITHPTIRATPRIVISS